METLVGRGGAGGAAIEYLDAPALPGPQPYTVGGAGGSSNGAGGGTGSVGADGSSPGASLSVPSRGRSFVVGSGFGDAGNSGNPSAMCAGPANPGNNGTGGVLVVFENTGT